MENRIEITPAMMEAAVKEFRTFVPQDDSAEAIVEGVVSVLLEAGGYSAEWPGGHDLADCEVEGDDKSVKITPPKKRVFR